MGRSPQPPAALPRAQPPAVAGGRACRVRPRRLCAAAAALSACFRLIHVSVCVSRRLCRCCCCWYEWVCHTEVVGWGSAPEPAAAVVNCCRCCCCCVGARPLLAAQAVRRPLLLPPRPTCGVALWRRCRAVSQQQQQGAKATALTAPLHAGRQPAGSWPKRCTGRRSRLALALALVVVLVRKMNR